MSEKTKRRTESLLLDIRAVVDTRAKARGFSTVLDLSAGREAFAPVILYHNGENDLTDDVLKELNASAPPVAPVAAKP